MRCLHNFLGIRDLKCARNCRSVWNSNFEYRWHGPNFTKNLGFENFCKVAREWGYVTTLQELLKVKGFMKQVFRKRSFYIVFHQKFELCDWWWEEICDSVIRFVKLEVKLYRGVGRPKDQAKKQVRLRTTIFFNTYRIEVINIDFEARTLKS